MTADQKYAIAMATSGDLLREMREEEHSSDPARQLMASIWLQRRNIPYMTTVYEAVEEARSPIDQKPE